MGQCKIDGCEKKYVARGWCGAHYKRWQIHGDPLFTEKPRDRKCSAEGCNKKHSSLGYCSTHERQFRRHGHIGTYLKRFDSFLSAYESQVIKNNSGCWGWRGSISSAGYGLIFCNNQTKWAHRFSFEFYKEPIIADFQVCHHCDNPLCTNPEHLFQGTQLDNVQDCISKERFKFVLNSSKAKGENVFGSKLKANEVKKIKQMIKQGMSNIEIARLYNVTHGNISSIRCGHTWKHVEG